MSDFQVFKLSQSAGAVSATRLLPSDEELKAGKRIVGPKVAVTRNLKDTSNTSYFVAGMMNEVLSPDTNGSGGPDCDRIEVTIARDRISVPKGFVSDPVQLVVNGTGFKTGYLQDFAQMTADKVPLVSFALKELEIARESDGGNILLPKGCGFTTDGKNLFNNFWLSANSFAADDLKVCRRDLSSLIDPNDSSRKIDMKIVCAAAPVIPSVVLDMAKDGEQWFGRVAGQVYSKRESIRFNRTEMFHTTEYFKSKDCSGTLVSIKTDSGVYSLPEVDVSGTIPIDIKFFKASGKIVGSDWFKSLIRAERYIGSCGISDWKIGEERDLPADKTCFMPKKLSARMQILGDELRICGEDEGALMTRPEDCRGVLLGFKRFNSR
jgi:hypothetical protein